MNERLKAARKALRLTQREFGERLGVTDGAISNLEKGERNFTDQMILAICREFSINEEWLRTGDGEMFVENDGAAFAKAAQTYNLDDFDVKLLEAYAKLPFQRRLAFQDFIKELMLYVEADLFEVLESGVYNEIGQHVTDSDEIEAMNEGIKELFEDTVGMSEGKKDTENADPPVTPPRSAAVPSNDMEAASELTEDEYLELARARFRASKKGDASSMTLGKQA